MRRDPSKWSIPVTYKGNTFRSHLEARWAVFFDLLGLKYEYEPALERVQTGLCEEVLYAPDFHLESESFDLMVEIKPKEPEESELIKAAAWAKELNDVLILFGPLQPPPDGAKGWLMTLPEGVIHHYTVPILEKDYWFCECPKCGSLGIAKYGGVPESCIDTCFSDMGEDEAIDFLSSHEGHLSPNLLAAYKKARTFKFEPSTSRARPKYPAGPPTPKMVDFLITLLHRAGEDMPSRDEIESMRFNEVKAWIDDLLHKDEDEWR